MLVQILYLVYLGKVQGSGLMAQTVPCLTEG